MTNTRGRVPGGALPGWAARLLLMAALGTLVANESNC